MIATAPVMVLPIVIEMMIMVIAPLLALASAASAQTGKAADRLLPILDEMMVKPLLRSFDSRQRKRMVAYLRFSTPGQSVHSIERQMFLLHQAAEQFGLEIVEVFEDRGVSGVHVSRPGLDKALAYIRAGRAQGILVEDCDRLARRCSIIPTLYDELKDLGCELWDRHHGFIDTAMKASLLAGMAAEDHRKIAERTAYGRRQKVEAGAIFQEPFGYARNKETGELEILPEKAEILLRINADLRAGINPAAIARALNAESAPTPSAASWNPVTVRVLARQLLQVGEHVYGRFKAGLRKPQTLPTVRVQHPRLAIMSRDDYLAALHMLDYKPRPAKDAEASEPKLRESSDILHGKMFCCVCGRRMYVRDPSRPALTSKGKDFFCWDLHGIQKRHNLAASVVRKIVVEEIAGELAGEAFEARFTEHAVVARATRGASAARSRSRLSNRITAAKEEIARSFDDVSWARGFSEERKAGRRQELERRVTQANEELAALDKEMAAIAQQGARLGDLKSALDELVQLGLSTDDSRRSLRQRALIGAVLHDVAVTPHVDGGSCLLRILLAPAGDAGSPQADVMVIEREIYSTRNVNRNAKLYADLRSASSQGRWTLSEREYSSLLDAQPALRDGLVAWTNQQGRELLNAALICNAVKLAPTHVDVLIGSCRDRARFLCYKLARSGTLAEFFRAASQIDATRFTSLDPAWPVITGRRSHVVIPR